MLLHPELKAGLLALKYVKLGDKAASALPIFMQALAGARVIRKYVLALLTKFKCDRELIWRELCETKPEEEETMLTVEEQIKEEGRREAETRARADMLMLQLRTRFREVPDCDEQRIRRASATALDRWAVQVPGARSLREALA